MLAFWDGKLNCEPIPAAPWRVEIGKISSAGTTVSSVVKKVAVSVALYVPV